MSVAFSHIPVKKTAVDGAVVPGAVEIGGMVYIATAAGSAILQDELGNDVINLNAAAAGMVSYNLPKPNQLAGYRLTTLTNGTAYIYFY